MDEAGRDSSGISGAALGGHRDRIGGHVLESGLDLETSARNLSELPGREDPDPRLRVLSRVEGASGSCPGPPAVQPARHGRVSGGRRESRGETGFETLGVMNANPVAMERGGAPEDHATVDELHVQRRDPRIVGEVRNFFLEATQYITPDPGRTGHSSQPITNDEGVRRKAPGPS